MPGPTGTNPLVNDLFFPPSATSPRQIVQRTDCACCGNCRPSSWGRWTYQYREDPNNPGFVGGHPPGTPGHPNGTNAAREHVELRGGNPYVHIYGATGGLENFNDTYFRLNGGTDQGNNGVLNQFHQQPIGVPPPATFSMAATIEETMAPGQQFAPAMLAYLEDPSGFGLNPAQVSGRGPQSVGNVAPYWFGEGGNPGLGGFVSGDIVGRTVKDPRKPDRIEGPVWCWADNPQGMYNTAYNGGLVMGQDATQTFNGDHPSNPDRPVVLRTTPSGELSLFDWGPPVTVNPYTTPTTGQEILALNAGPNPWQTTRLTVTMGAPLAGQAFLDFRSGSSPADDFFRFVSQVQLDRGGLYVRASGIPDYTAAFEMNECVQTGTWEVPCAGFRNGKKNFLNAVTGLINFGTTGIVPKNWVIEAPRDGYENHIALASQGQVLNVFGGASGSSTPAGGPTLIPKQLRFFPAHNCNGFPNEIPQFPYYSNAGYWIRATPSGFGTYQLRMYVYAATIKTFMFPGMPIDPSTVAQFLAVSAPVGVVIPASTANWSVSFTGWTFDNENNAGTGLPIFCNWPFGPGGASGPKYWTTITLAGADVP